MPFIQVYMVIWVVGRRSWKKCQNQCDMSRHWYPHTQGIPFLLGKSTRHTSHWSQIDHQYTRQDRVMVHETPALYEKYVKPYISAFPASRTTWWIIYNFSLPTFAKARQGGKHSHRPVWTIQDPVFLSRISYTSRHEMGSYHHFIALSCCYYTRPHDTQPAWLAETPCWPP